MKKKYVVSLSSTITVIHGYMTSFKCFFFLWGGGGGGGKKLFLNIPLEFSNEIKFVQSEYF